MSLVKPSPLKKGDTIHIVASSSPFERDDFDRGVALLKSWGYQVTYDESIFDRIPYLAGTDERRAAELIAALESQDCQAILFARGGYGAMRLLPYLDKANTKFTPKIVLGYSDISCLLSYIYNKHQWLTFYGPVIAKDLQPETHPETLESLKRVLSDQNLSEYSFHENVSTIKEGITQAPLIGGCLSIITSLLGTPYAINTDNHILFLEDINEKPYEIDRMLTQLKLAGKFDKCRGLIFGSLAGPNPQEHYIETIQTITKDYEFPVVFNLPFGHATPKLTLPLGLDTTLDTKQKRIIFSQKG